MARFTFLGLVSALSLFSALPAAKAASIADCGNIDVQANAQCTVTPPDCTAQCTPINCSASLYAQCKTGDCKVITPSCNASCNADCEGRCSGNANFDCTADCTGQCNAQCSGTCTTHCQNDADQTTCVNNCNASCAATCQGECDASCSGNASVDCQGRCTASCQGSCNGIASINCQATCQANGYVQCTGGCVAECNSNAALFCNGQYLDEGGNLQSCIDALEAQLNINVQYGASGSCSGNSCQGEAHASASCALARLGEKKGLSSGLLILGAAGLVIGVRRRRR